VILEIINSMPPIPEDKSQAQPKSTPRPRRLFPNVENEPEFEEPEPAIIESNISLNIEPSQLAVQLCQYAKNREQWFSVVRFGLSTLLNDPLILIECILIEAKREYELGDDTAASVILGILEELELKITKS